MRALGPAALLVVLAGSLGAQQRIVPDIPAEVAHALTAREKPSRWRVALAAAHVDDIRPVGRKLLVGLREDQQGLRPREFTLVDRDSGRVEWRWPRPRDLRSEVVAAAPGVLLLEETKRQTSTFLGVDPATGAERWRVSVGEVARSYPLIEQDRLLLQRRDGDRVELVALNLSTGLTTWTRPTRVPRDSAILGVLAEGEAVWTFQGRVERLSTGDGSVAWARPDIRPDDGGPTPQLADGELLLVQGTHLLALSAGTGETRWQTPVPGLRRATNIFLTESRVYLRGEAEGGGFALCAFARADGRMLWRTLTGEPLISNIVETPDRTFAASSATLFGFDPASGRFQMTRKVATTGRLFPVHLRLYADRIVYVGELAVAAYALADGSQLYFQGITPIDQEATLNGLDAAIPRLREAMASLGNPRAQGTPLSAFASAEAQRYQDMSGALWRQAGSQRALGDRAGAQLTEARAQQASESSRNMSRHALTMALTELGASLFQAIVLDRQLKSYQVILDRQEFLRRSILAATQLAEVGDYVYRPASVSADGGPIKSLTGLVVVDLPTGRRSETPLSPHYRVYGLWNYLDAEEGLVFHHGIGLDEAAWEYTPEHSAEIGPKVQTVGAFLIAAPVHLPR
ncbi:MAG: PQQ-binding-like beta-propeller repeat protein [Gemmatimonadetes bacterium]|nr:PQQ-binding-like beta-propeller repeat protein [Gemmatimonadota bacterium]